MSDTFHERVPKETVDAAFEVMQRCPQHMFLLFTKRPEQMKGFVSMGFQGRDERIEVCPPAIWPGKGRATVIVRPVPLLRISQLLERG